MANTAYVGAGTTRLTAVTRVRWFMAVWSVISPETSDESRMKSL